MSTTHLLVPMSGRGIRFQNAGYKEPKPLISINGVPMIKRLMGIFPDNWPKHFVISEDHKITSLPDYLTQNFHRATLNFVPHHNKGPAIPILEGLKNIPPKDSVFVSYCDYGMIWDSNQFSRFVEDSNCDVCIISYKGFHPHYLGPTKYAYSKIENDVVVEVKEKGSFTQNRELEFASSGGYFFKSAKVLKQAVEFQIEKNMQINGEFYTSLTVQALIESLPNSKVTVFEIPYFFQWGTPEDLKRYEYWENSFRSQNKTKELTSSRMVDQILIPMAGEGSRFNEISLIPKPFLPIHQSPMFERAIRSLPTVKKTVVVAQRKHQSYFEGLDFSKSVSPVWVDKTPGGQALSTEIGLSVLDPGASLIVSSCDHEIVLSMAKLDRFLKDPKCDAAIFSVKKYPGVSDFPSSYSYIKAKSDEEFPDVDLVSVKKTISHTPTEDHLLVGTFWFAKAKTAQIGIDILKKEKLFTNGELYLDSIFNLLIENGFRVKIVPLDGFICWGDPSSFSEALYWREVFWGQNHFPRSKFGWVPTNE